MMLTPRQKYEVCRVKSGVALVPIINSTSLKFGFSTRFGNTIIDRGDGSSLVSYSPIKNYDYSSNPASNNFTVGYSSSYSGNVSFKFLKGLNDVYSIGFYKQDSSNPYNITDIATFFSQFPNLYSIGVRIITSGQTRTHIFRGDLAKLPDSVEKVFIDDMEILGEGLEINFSNYTNTSKLKWFKFLSGFSGTTIKILGDIVRIPALCSFFSLVRASGDSSIIYTAGKVWASAFDTLSIPLSLGNFLEVDALFTDMGNSITSAVGGKVINIGGWVSLKSLAQRNYLTGLGFTLTGFLDTSTGTASSTTQKFIGDIAQIPSDITFFKIVQCATGSEITYTSGKVWASAFDTLSIPLPLSHTELDALLADMDGSIMTKIGAGVIAIGGYRSSASDGHVASLQAKGFTVNIAKLNFFQRILDLPFQNNLTDSGEMGMTMVAGGTSNQPTFALSGRKAGEYCAVFNGSQSIKTTANLPINSDKVTLAFWMKTTQTAVAIIAELSSVFDSNNAFAAYTNSPANRFTIADHTSGSIYNRSSGSTTINTGVWLHISAIIDRSMGTNQATIYINGSLVTVIDAAGDLNGNFVNNILFIGQRAGSSLGFNGSLTKLKIYNYPFTATEVSTLYNSEL